MRELVCLVAFLMATAPGADGAEADCPLSRQVKPFAAQNEKRIAALVRFGRENLISFGVESAGEDLVQPITVKSDSKIAQSAILQILGGPRAYRISCVNGVVLVQNNRSASPKWLDERLPLFRTARTTLLWASTSLSMQLEMILNPDATGFAGHMPPGDREDEVGPFEMKGVKARDLLCLLVGSSKGGTWIATRIDDLGVASHNRYWTLVPYASRSR